MPFTALESALLPQQPLSAKALGPVVAAAVLPGIIAYQAYSFMLKELGATRAGLVLYPGMRPSPPGCSWASRRRVTTWRARR